MISEGQKMGNRTGVLLLSPQLLIKIRGMQLIEELFNNNSIDQCCPLKSFQVALHDNPRGHTKVGAGETMASKTTLYDCRNPQDCMCSLTEMCSKMGRSC